MRIHFFNRDNGAHLGFVDGNRVTINTVDGDISRIAAANSLGENAILPWVDTEEMFLDDINASIVDGHISEVTVAPAPPVIWVHVTITGGNTSPAGTQYIKNDGVDVLNVHAELWPDQVKGSPEDQITHNPNGTPITEEWALELINKDTGSIADAPLVQITAGVIDTTYKTNIAPCEVLIDESRFEEISGFQLKLAQPVSFKVVRALG